MQLTTHASDLSPESAVGLFPTLAKWILLPINDRYAAEAADNRAGSHWSLLVVADGADADNVTARHYDSLPGNNEAAARRVWSKYLCMVGAPAKSMPASQNEKEAELGDPRLTAATELNSQSNSGCCRWLFLLK